MPPPARRLSTRIVSVSLLALLIALATISGTLWLSWQLEGAGAAINDAGSLRMRANRIGIELYRLPTNGGDAVLTQLSELDGTLERLRRGNPSRPLFLPNAPVIHDQLGAVTREWEQTMKPAALAATAASPSAHAGYLAALPGFVAQADRLVKLIEQDNAAKTTWLRMSQAALAAIACMGTVAMIYLLYCWIILPVLRLQDGLRRIATREFSLRLPVETHDEFGMLTEGFNRMASELEDVYHGLEARVAEKTAELAAHNRDLSTLYDMAAFLNQPNDIQDMCQGFLTRVMRQFGASGGSVRVVDERSEQLHLVVSEGLPQALREAEHCMNTDACHCGQAVQAGIVMIKDLRAATARAAVSARAPADVPCATYGLPAVAAFSIVSQNAVLGSFSLHFDAVRELPPSDRQLLAALGQNLGAALDHLRLSATARQLAVVEERNLVAQGLHDSIAQGLNYLNLQVQLLEQAAHDGRLHEIREVVPLLRCGVRESYDDVRELLLNFRTRLSQGELVRAVEDTAERFRRQCPAELTLTIDPEPGGRPLPPDQQLQVLFILQEALSNVRKHAGASHVAITLSNGYDFGLVVDDDGCGIDPDALAARSEAHIGLHIMRERAARLRASLAIGPRPGGGTRVALLLPRGERVAA